MAGVESAGAHYLQSFVEAEVVVLNQVEQSLQTHESGMTLVAVINIFLDAQLIESEHTTYTQHYLLFETVLYIAAVELMGDRAVPLRVEIVVGIKQIEVDTTHCHSP